MNDELLEYLGDYFVKYHLRIKHGWTFEKFVEGYNSGGVDLLAEFNIYLH